MRIDLGSTIAVHNPSPPLLAWAKENLEIPNPEYTKKVRMHFWLGNTPKTLHLYQTDGESIILPFGILRDVMPYLRGFDIHTLYKDANPIDYGSDIPLYDYQEIAVQAAVKAKYGILQSPAGSGKTQMGIAIVKRYGRKALWLTHTQDLLSQSKERAERYMDSSLIGTITEGKVNIGKGITFATIQTMCKLDLDSYRDLWDVIIVDECHRVAGSPTAVTQFYKVLNALSARHKYGLSATVHRSDGMIAATYALLGRVIYTVPDAAVEDKIMKVGIRAIGTNTSESYGYLNGDGTLNYTRLINYLCEDRERNELIGRLLIQEREHSCLILSDRLEHLEGLMNALPPDLRKQAVMISGKMTSKKGKQEREQAIEDMRQGEKRYLFASYNLCKEGLDIPRLDRLFMTTPVKDYAVVVQSIGRIARTFQGKADAIAIDLVDNIPYLYRCYKQRWRHYHKVGCYAVEGDE